MRATSGHPEPFNLPQLWAALQDLEEGQIGDHGRDALMRQLDASPAARRGYLEYYQQVAIFRMEASKLLEGEELMATQPIVTFKPKPWKQWLAAAASIAIACWVGTLIFRQDNTSDAVATYWQATTTKGSQWKLNGVHQKAGLTPVKIKQGDSVEVLAGMARLELESGSVIVMESSSKASFIKLLGPVLESGWIWIDTGSTNDAFEVSTPELKIQDIGTRFGVHIDQSGTPEIHLMDGGLHVISQESGIRMATLAPDGKARKLDKSGSLEPIPLADDPFPLLASRLYGESSYGTAIILQKPTHYWKFNEGIEGRFDNMIPGNGRTAKSGPSVKLVPNGVDQDPQYNGFGSESQSLYFPAYEKDWTMSVVGFLDGGKGISRNQGAASFWIKQKLGARDQQILWLAGSNSPSRQGPGESYAYTQLNPDGQVVFNMREGGNMLSIQSKKPIEQNHWHHLAISWDRNHMDLYIDGKRVAQRDDERVYAEWTSKGNSVRFGKPTSELVRAGKRSFHGWLDEFALWDRPLLPEEVEMQFKAAIQP